MRFCSAATRGPACPCCQLLATPGLSEPDTVAHERGTAVGSSVHAAPVNRAPLPASSPPVVIAVCQLSKQGICRTAHILVSTSSIRHGKPMARTRCADPSRARHRRAPSTATQALPQTVSDCCNMKRSVSTCAAQTIRQFVAELSESLDGRMGAARERKPGRAPHENECLLLRRQAAFHWRRGESPHTYWLCSHESRTRLDQSHDRLLCRSARARVCPA